MKFMTRSDLYIISAVILISFSGYIMTGASLGGEDKTVIIEVDGKVFAKYSMNDITEPKIIDINGHNKLEITKTYVRMIEANCPDKLDIKQGKISSAGQIIICMPNRTTARIEGKSSVDGISY